MFSVYISYQCLRHSTFYAYDVYNNYHWNSSRISSDGFESFLSSIRSLFFFYINSFIFYGVMDIHNLCHAVPSLDKCDVTCENPAYRGTRRTGSGVFFSHMCICRKHITRFLHNFKNNL